MGELFELQKTYTNHRTTQNRDYRVAIQTKIS